MKCLLLSGRVFTVSARAFGICRCGPLPSVVADMLFSCPLWGMPSWKCFPCGVRRVEMSLSLCSPCSVFISFWTKSFFRDSNCDFGGGCIIYCRTSKVVSVVWTNVLGKPAVATCSCCFRLRRLSVVKNQWYWFLADHLHDQRRWWCRGKFNKDRNHTLDTCVFFL